MDGLIDISAARDLVSDEALWPRVRDFLWNFAPQIHPTWLEGLQVGQFAPSSPPPESLQPLLASRFVSSWVLSKLRVEPVSHAFPANDGSRLLLLDASTLLSLASWLGALSSASALRRVTRGPDVAALKTALPGIYPALFAYTAYFAKTGILDASAETAPATILANGCAFLFSALAPLPAPLLHRLRLKLPAPADQSITRTTELPLPHNDPTIQRSNLQTIKLLLKLKFPEACALCFS